MNEQITLGQIYLKELEAESAASRKCLERVPENVFEWKPHEKSMKMKSLALIVADIPRWITHMITQGDIDFATYTQASFETTAELVALFDKNLEEAKKALDAVSEEALEESFSLKNNGQVLFTSPKKDTVGSSINHLVHHRGQLTVYLRLNNLPVPVIYGPSADEQGF